jgi:hypothetical protein
VDLPDEIRAFTIELKISENKRFLAISRASNRKMALIASLDSGLRDF